MAKVSKYSMLFYSGANGYQNSRAQITVSDSAGNTLAFIRFKDPGMPFEPDTDSNGIITMHLPSAVLPSVVDALRNETSDIYYQIGQAFLYTGVEPAGEGDKV